MNNLFSASAVKKRFGVSDMTLWRWIEDTALNFPRPIYIKRNRYWYENELTDWLESQRG